jgi:hypothetical protein
MAISDPVNLMAFTGYPPEDYIAHAMAESKAVAFQRGNITAYPAWVVTVA